MASAVAGHRMACWWHPTRTALHESHAAGQSTVRPPSRRNWPPFAPGCPVSRRLAPGWPVGRLGHGARPAACYCLRRIAFRRDALQPRGPEGRRFTSVPSLGVIHRGNARRPRRVLAVRWRPDCCCSNFWWDLSEGAVFRWPVEQGALILLYAAGKCIVKLSSRTARQSRTAKPVREVNHSERNKGHGGFLLRWPLPAMHVDSDSRAGDGSRVQGGHILAVVPARVRE
jgi:hypothetical protein